MRESLSYLLEQDIDDQYWIQNTLPPKLDGLDLGNDNLEKGDSIIDII